MAQLGKCTMGFSTWLTTMLHLQRECTSLLQSAKHTSFDGPHCMPEGMNTNYHIESNYNRLHVPSIKVAFNVIVCVHSARAGATLIDCTCFRLAGVSTDATGPPGFETPDGIDQWEAIVATARGQPPTQFPRNEVVIDMLSFGDSLEEPTAGKQIVAMRYAINCACSERDLNQRKIQTCSLM